MGATITIPYKSELDQWFDKIELYKSFTHKFYMISGGTIHFKKCETFEEAYELFSSFFNNVGILQLKVMRENPDIDFVDNFDKNLEKLKKLISDI